MQPWPMDLVPPSSSPVKAARPQSGPKTQDRYLEHGPPAPSPISSGHRKTRLGGGRMLSRSELTTGHGRAAEMAVARARHALQGAEPLVSTASATWYEEDERDLLLVRVFGIVFSSNASLSKDRDNKTQ
ncbi:hypothetical protein FALCPG4_003352 [Fusarium falciforme]